MPSSVQRARGLFNSFEKRRRDCSVRLMLVVRLCSCSAAKGAEYFSTARYSWPCTSSFSATARTPCCSALRQLVTRVGAGNVGVEVGGIVGQQPATDQLLLLPQTE